MSHILVTGCAGFIGSHFTDYAVEKGHAVVGIDDLSYGKKGNINSAIQFEEEDIRNYTAVEKIILKTQPTHIVHFAANATTKSSSLGWNDPMTDYSINMVGTLNILQILRKHDLDCRLVYASTAAVYGEPQYVPMDEIHPNFPVSPYGITKLAGEKYCHAYSKEFGIESTILRIFNTFGPRQPRYVMYDQMIKMMKKPETFEVLGTGEQLRDYVYVSDTVMAVYTAMIHENAVNEIFNIARGDGTSIKDLVGMIKSVLNVDSEPVFTGESWKGDITRLWAKTSKINTLLNWKPEVPLETGLHRLADWIKQNETT